MLEYLFYRRIKRKIIFYITKVVSILAEHIFTLQYMLFIQKLLNMLFII